MQKVLENPKYAHILLIHTHGCSIDSFPRLLGIGHILCGSVALLIDLAKLLMAGDPTFALFASVPWFVSGGFAIGGAVTKTRYRD